MKKYNQYIKEKIDHESPILKIAKEQGMPYDQITILRCSNNQLNSLDGIENLVNLQYLYCHNNKLDSLEGIENLVNLQQLYCSSNQLTSLEGIENLVNLRQLNCSYNQLTSLEGIENLVNLQIFSCHNNQLTSLDGIENLVNLQILGCSNNRLNSLEFGDFSLDAFELGIDETDLRRFKKLNFLSCIGNQFSNKYIKYIREYCKRKNITSNI